MLTNTTKMPPQPIYSPTFPTLSFFSLPIVMRHYETNFSDGVKGRTRKAMGQKRCPSPGVPTDSRNGETGMVSTRCLQSQKFKHNGAED